MSRIDIMTDIETLGTNSDSTIFQIAAVAFDIETGERKSHFNQIADVGQNESMNVTGDTIKWWLNNNGDLLKDLLNKGERCSESLLHDFHCWLESQGMIFDEVYLWGNGILFDNKMIEHQFKEIELDYPIHYKNDRDVRTIVDLVSKKLGISEKELKDKFNDKSLVKHDAYDDVIYQINLVVNCYNELIK